MRLRRALVLGLLAGSLAFAGFVVASETANARQRPVALIRFLLGYFDGKSRFVPISGGGGISTAVDRNAISMFVFSGAIDMGPNLKARLPLTLAEQVELEARQAQDPNFDPAEEGFEPGVIPTKLSPIPQARVVATGSVTQESIQIASPSAGGGSTLAEGVFFKVRKRRKRRLFRNRVTFNPQFINAVFNKPQEIDYNPEGLDGFTIYTVSLRGGQGAQFFNSITNLDGSVLAAPFQTQFATADGYTQDFTRPEVRETVPTDGSIGVATDADVELTFNEPMSIESFRLPLFQGDDTATVSIAYTDDPQNGTLAGKNILAIVRVKPQTAGQVIQIRPIQGFGKGPFEVEVTVTVGVTDLSGNNIIREQRFRFETEFNADALSFNDITENFNDNQQEDTSYVPTGDNLRALWDNQLFPGLLTTEVQGVGFDIFTSPQPPNGVNIWNMAAIQFQALYSASDMGSRERVLFGGGWYSTTVNGLTYPNMSLQIGHATDVIDASGFPTTGPNPGFYRDVPVTLVLPQSYTAPGPSNGLNVWPQWITNFNFDGVHGVILELNHGGNGSAAPFPGNSDFWNYDPAFSRNAAVFTLQVNPVFTAANPWFFSVRFFYLTPGAEAQSLWYNVGIDNATYLTQQLVGFQPAGTTFNIEWQGAKGLPASPDTLDPSTITPFNFTADIRTLDRNRFLRFKVTLFNNLSALTTLAIDILVVPFTFR